MNLFMIVAQVLAGSAVLVGGWLAWQLLRQNGRLLLRLDDLENRLNELELGDPAELAGLPVGSAAPAFELPDLAGDTRTLAQYRGQSVLLIFFNPACGFCRELVPKLAALPHSQLLVHPMGEGGRRPGNGRPLPLILTTGDAESNRQLFAKHKLSCPVLLQKQTEVATAYHANGTPAGYLIDAEGKIATEMALGAEALLALADGKGENQNSEPNEPVNGNGRMDRFSSRSLARSKIKRDGLKAGTRAPDFRLPRLDGRGELSLSELRGRRVLLVFSDPHCGPCNTLAPELERIYRNNNQSRCSELSLNASHAPLTPSLSPWDGERVAGRPGEGNCPETAVVMISRGEPKENRAKVKEHGLTFPVVLQQQWEISRRYAMFATPIAYLIDESGVIAQNVAVGTDAILDLMSRAEWLRDDIREVA